MGPEFAADARASADARANDPRGGNCSGNDSGGNGWRAQQADALIAIAKAYLTGGGRGHGAATSASAADHCQVVVHVDDSALRGGPGRSDLPIDTVKRLTCDGSLVTIVEDDHGTPLDVGRKRRTVSTPLKRALWSRDRGCSFPKMSPYALRRRASHSPLGGRRRHEPREPHAAVLAPSHVAARGPVHDPARSRRCDLLPARGWAGDSAARLSARRPARRLHAGRKALRGGARERRVCTRSEPRAAMSAVRAIAES